MDEPFDRKNITGTLAGSNWNIGFATGWGCPGAVVHVRIATLAVTNKYTESSIWRYWAEAAILASQILKEPV